MPATTLNGKILGLFHNLTALQHQTALPLDAQAEALATLSSQKKVKYKKLAKGPTPINPAKGSQKACISTGSSHTQSCLDSSIFHISSVTMVVCGIDKDSNLKHLKAPGGKTYFSEGLFSIVQVVQPNGSTLLENKVHGKAGIVESTLWFASQKAVPDDIYESWNTEPVVMGSDSDADSCNFSVADMDVISISGTSSNSENGSDIKDKLLSSMIDLELHHLIPYHGWASA
ncbi:hypothetical protein EV401DRAFT_2080530 [Pisolithus croceorrhizus]|nr:hypothetical protein EV401DRAFT_2080530 [Pisolithus croceorrhizus]